MATKFTAPANLKDFDRSSQAAALHESWHQNMSGIVTKSLPHYPAAFSDVDRPVDAGAPKAANPEWTGLPRTIKRLVPSIAAAAKLVDSPRAIGDYDPVDMGRYQQFHDKSGSVFAGPQYRSQDEYLEWSVKRDEDGVISEILFTAEGPEYWEHIAQDEKLLVTLYQELAENNTVKLNDLVFPREVTWKNPYSSSPNLQQFKAGSYNPFNKWNMSAAVHLTQPANTLGAEIKLALDATRPYGIPNLVTTDPDLACCAAYGGINRMSDPTIGAGVNAQVIQLKRRVALRNPIGLYIKRLQPNSFTLSDGSAFPDQDLCWEVLRPEKTALTDMVVRARFRVPQAIKFKGKQLRVGDLFVSNEQIVTGGQVADVVTMTLFALAIPGAPAQTAVACSYRPCRDKEFPDFIQPIPYNSTCEAGGTSPQGAALMNVLANAKLFDLDAGIKETGTEQPAIQYTRAKLF